ncbi:hypothetical protein FAUST_10296 [Fusarium austroamericanum]|uniref:Mannose-1-phosphate guanylyltransferase n=1 Tax=Fusarium austroamericanum TaxID=282268 RepID=A0AAN5Z140_FUSAU|nr:hypothetical protein FAUST_10296 [Fusarium austroamericanum]
MEKLIRALSRPMLGDSCMSLDSDPFKKMAATIKDPQRIVEIRESEIPVPWCDDFGKMISGMNLDISGSPALNDYKLGVMRKLRAFNNDDIPDDATLSSIKMKRMALAKQMIGRMGKSVNIETPFFIVWGCNTFIGNGVYMNREISIYDNALVSIGDNVLIGPGVCICTTTHATDIKGRREAQGTSYSLPIRIESDCWIGARVTILPGVTIGRGSTVAAGAVVHKDVEPETLVGGVPARFIRSLKDVPKDPDMESIDGEL